MQPLPQFKDQVRKAILNADFDRAFQLIGDTLVCEGSPVADDAALLVTRYNLQQRFYDSGAVTCANHSAELVRLAANAMKFLDDLPAEALGASKPSARLSVTQTVMLVVTSKERAEAIQALFRLLDFNDTRAVILSDLAEPPGLEGVDLVIFDNTDLQECPLEEMLKQFTEEDRARILARINDMHKLITASPDRTPVLAHFGKPNYWINEQRKHGITRSNHTQVYESVHEALEATNVLLAF